MTQLIVRPIDDDRYSKESQFEYVMLLKSYNSPGYTDAFVRFTLKNYTVQMTKAANEFGKQIGIAIQRLRDAFAVKSEHI